MRNILLLTCCVAFGAGCGVSKQVVEQQRAELDLCRAAVTACENSREQLLAESAVQAQALRGQVTEAEGRLAECRIRLGDTERALSSREEMDKRMGRQIEQLQAEVQESHEAATAAEEQAARLRAREDEMRRQLQQELAEKTVVIENLEDQLAVRVVDRILFTEGDDAILPRGRKVLDKLALALAGGKERIRVEGHTDDLPIGASLKNRYFSNWELSAARAASVVRYLQHAHGIGSERMEVVGLAEFQPLADNSTAEARTRNRRVEIVLSQ